MRTILYILILLAGFPVGFYLSKICKDEIKKWRGRLMGVSVISLALALGIAFISFEYKFPVIMGLFFTIITCLTIIYRSH
tara:strand:+ start:417 stop:656 length:240 start_codon:yes stop_codon:yes gene_type:complete